MALVNQDGKLLLRNGALATGQACCCNPCSGPCDEENPCPEGCACVNGECVSPCCINGAIDSSYTSQESCEECATTNFCNEYIYLEDPEASCPEGWTSDGWGGCYRTTNPASCESCSGYCYPVQSGPCGVWLTGDILERTNPCLPCDESCLASCSVQQTLYYEVSGAPQDVTPAGGTYTIWVSGIQTLTYSYRNWQWRPGYGPSSCNYYELLDSVTHHQYGTDGLPYYPVSREQARLFVVDCEHGDLVDVTGLHTFNGPIITEGCIRSSFSVPFAQCNPFISMPALKPQPPQLICPP